MTGRGRLSRGIRGRICRFNASCTPAAKAEVCRNPAARTTQAGTSWQAPHQTVGRLRNRFLDDRSVFHDQLDRSIGGRMHHVSASMPSR